MAAQLPAAKALPSGEELVASDAVEAVVVTSWGPTHEPYVLACIAAGKPVFCEKPLATTQEACQRIVDAQGSTAHPSSKRLAQHAHRTHRTRQIGFQRRYDAAIAAARAAVVSGELGWINTIRSTTLDPEPPPPEYVAVSGGMFRDCGVHDFDVVRWVTGQDAVEVYATGSNRGADFFRRYDDVDTSAAIVIFADGALGVVSNTRYNGRGYDVRLEVHGSKDSVAAGVDDGWPIRATEPGVTFPSGPPHRSFMDPVPAGLPVAVRDLPRGGRLRPALAVHGRRRAGGGLDRRGLRQIDQRAPAGAYRGGSHRMTATTVPQHTGPNTAEAPISHSLARRAG